ncbi:MAG: hypothetical protein LIO75_09200 [Lachnospiraceae bacterium]|nr:hypothetical protein [Lachnospiraceae bacterium]
MGGKRRLFSEKKNGRNFRRRAVLPGTIAAVCVFAVFMVNRGGYADSLFRKNRAEAEQALVDATSTSYRYEREFVYTLWKYGALREFYVSDFSTAIPGLENTCFPASHSNQMVPQGICIAGDYMLISAYDKSGLEKSVIYVLSNDDPANRNLITTIVLPDKNHVGGIAFDGSSVWVAKSTSRRLSEISREQIEAAAVSGQSVFELKEYDSEFNCGVIASFIGYQDDRLWVGTSHSFLGRQGGLTVFRRAETEDADAGETADEQANVKPETDAGEAAEEQTNTKSETDVPEAAETKTKAGTALKEKSEAEDEVKWIRQFSMEIPDYAQGIAFFSEEGKDYLLLSTSHGRFQSSYLYLYEETISDEKVLLSARAKYEMPPMAEELVSDGGYTYCLFESAATCYSVGEGLKYEYPVDRVCALDNYLLAGKEE